MLFRQFVDEDLGCASYLVGDAFSGVAVGSIRPSRSSSTSTRGGTRGCGSCGSSRRTPTPTTSRATAASRSNTACPSRSIRSPSPSTRSTRVEDGADRSASARSRSACAHARAPAGALRLRRRRRARPDRRLAVRGRRGATRPRDRGPPRRRRPLPLAAPSGRAARRGRPSIRASLGIALRDEHERRALDVDRPREGDERRTAGRRATSSRVGIGVDAEAADDRGWWRSTAVRGWPHGRRSGPEGAGNAPCSTYARSRTTLPATTRARSASHSTAARSRPARPSFRPARATSSCTRARAAEANEAARRLWSVGLFETRGYLTEGRGDRDDGRALTVPEFARLLEDGQDIQVLDVREENERTDGAIPRSDPRPVPPRATPHRWTSSTRARPVFTLCASGPRATLAASLLARERLRRESRRRWRRARRRGRSATRLVASR